MKKTFVDTNVLIYANDSRDAVKQEKALTCIGELMRNRHGVLSTQVLQEYANVALNKLQQRQDVVLRQLVLLEGLETVLIIPALIRRGIEIKAAYGIGFWDSIIISAAEHANCSLILSEDFNTGQFYSGIEVVNPFV